MVVSDASIRNIMEGMESTAGVRLHNHRRKLKQRFDIIKKLGQGTYGKVQLGINKETGQEVAIKTIKKAKIETEADLIRIRREIQIMSSVQHPNIIHIYEVFENREKMVLVMEYAAGGELYDYLSDRKVLTEEESRRIFRQIATAVYYCHKHKICHRDLKLENILLDEHGSAKIADFGLSNVFNDQRLLSTFCGSPLYASPEIVKGTPYHGPEVDCWSLGVLLYTLVYGAMPFDGSNFKRLVRQISNGDYFEPKTPSPASPLIKDMLNVVPARRADIEKICTHWWVNQGHEESCLDVAEELANQTPVRLDLLLSLAPPGPGVGSDKLMVGGEDDDGSIRSDGTAAAPARSHSVGSLMELDHPTVESKIREFQADKRRGSTGADYKDAPKRKLEEGISTEDAARGGAKRKDRSRRRERERSSERRQHRSSSSSKHGAQRVPLKGGEEMDVDVPPEGATALPAAEERPAEQEPPPVEPDDQESPALESPVQDVPARKTVKKKTKPEPESKTEDETVCGEQGSEEPPSRNEDTTAASVKGESTVADREPSVGEAEGKEVDIRKPEVPGDADKGDDKTAAEASEKDNEAKSRKDATKAGPKKVVTKTKKNKSDLTLGKLGSPEKSGASTPEDMASPTRVVERRRSKIFETAEKFNSLLSGGSEPAGGKPKKMFIPGVKVSDAKQAFERKSSLSGPSVPSPGPVKSSTAKKVAEPVVNGSSPTSTDVPAAASTAASARNGEDTKNGKLHPLKDTDKSNKTELVEGAVSADKPETMVNGKSDLADAENEEELDLKLIPALRIQDKSSEQAEARVKKLKEAREIISNAISEENKKDIADVVKRIAPGRPPVPAVKTKTAVGSGPASPTQVPEKKIEPERNDAATPEKKSSKVEITLKSATLPRRKTSKAEIKLEYPNGKVPSVEFRTEVAQMVGGATLPMTPNRLKTQRSEVAFPVAAAPPSAQHRSASLEPEGGVSKDKPRPREHIIPIQVEAGSEEKQGTSPGPPAARPPVPPLQHQRSQRSSLSRQSTADSDTDSTISVGPEPIRKSPREYIIPIAVEGGGYVTPRAGSLEPSTPDQGSEGHPLGGRQPGKLSRPRRMSSLLGDSGASEDEGFNSAFGTLHRHGDNPDEDRPFAHMHRLRSSRPRKHLEHTDSVSSAEEDDDDDNFEILTAESLFSTLLSRVRSLTQRLNVEDGMRPGFQSSRLLSQLANSVHPSSFISSVYGSNPSRRTSDSSHFSRSFSRDSDASTPWRRSISVSRDASDAGSEPKRGCVRPDRGTPSNDATSEPDDPTSAGLYTYTPSSSVSRCLQRQLSDTPGHATREDYVAAVLRSLESGEKLPCRRPSRALSRPESGRYLPLTRRSLSLLDSSSHGPLSSSASDKYNYNYRPLRSYKGGSASDCGDHPGHGVTETLGVNVLPPLPYGISSLRRREPRRNYGQQISSDQAGEREDAVLASVDVKRDDVLENDVSQFKNTSCAKESDAAKKTSLLPSGYLTGGVTLDSSPRKLNNDTKKNAFTTSQNEICNSSNACEINSTDQCKNVSLDAPEVNLSSVIRRCDNQENKLRSQIPSLSRFRSLSVCRDLDTSKLKKEALSAGVTSTPEKSILSKFFRQGSVDRVSGNVSSNEDKEKRKSGSSTRRISRFLRPDFFDTPREESEYAKQKEAKKAAEAEEKALARKKKLTEKLDAAKRVIDSNKVLGNDVTTRKVIGSKKLQDVKKTENSGKDCRDKEEKKNSAKKVDANVKDENEKRDAVVNNVSRKGDKTKSEAFVKQAGKNSFLHSLEKKLEKFCSSGDGVVPVNVRNSRVDKAIRSLRESSVAPPSSVTAITESNLLKRAVSADDCSNLVSSVPTGSSNSKVNSVLGLFRKLEGTSASRNQSLLQRSKRPTSMIVDQVKRSQAAYTGSHSDSALLSQLPVVKTEDKLQAKTDQSNNYPTPAPDMHVIAKEKTGKTVSAIRKKGNSPTIIKDEENVASSLMVNMNESQVAKMGTNHQSVKKDPVRTTNIKSIPRPTSLKGLKDVAVENNSSASNHLVGDTVAGHSKKLLPEMNNKLLEGRNERGFQTDGVNAANNVKSSHQLERRTCLELPSPADEAPSLVSPGDESGSQSFDSWSVSSDLESRENLSSPIPPYLVGDGIEESVGDRIRRKSYYSRFNNTNRKSRKSSVPVLSSSYSSSMHESSNPLQSRKVSPKHGCLRSSSFRSQSLYADDNSTYGRKSPVHTRGYYRDLVNNVGSVDMNDNLQNGLPAYADECSNADYGRIMHLDGYCAEDYTPYTCRNSERRLSRPTDFIRDVRRSSSYLPGLYSSLRAPSSASGYTDGDAKYNLPDGEVCDLGK